MIGLMHRLNSLDMDWAQYIHVRCELVCGLRKIFVVVTIRSWKRGHMEGGRKTGFGTGHLVKYNRYKM